MKIRVILRAIWSSPFDAGPLVRPVGIGDTILVLLQTIWRIIIIIFIAFFIYISYDFLSRVSIIIHNLSKGELKVSINIKQSSSKCPYQEYPLLVTISNQSTVIIRGVNFTMEAYVPGHSSDVIVYDKNKYYSDFIIKPHEIIEACASAPILQSNAAGQVVSYSTYDVFVWETSPLSVGYSELIEPSSVPPHPDQISESVDWDSLAPPVNYPILNVN